MWSNGTRAGSERFYTLGLLGVFQYVDYTVKMLMEQVEEIWNEAFSSKRQKFT